MNDKDKKRDRGRAALPDPLDDLSELEALVGDAKPADASLDEILAEFSDRARRADRRTRLPFTQPVMLRPHPEPEEAPEPPRVVDFPRRSPVPREESPPPEREAPEPPCREDKVIPLWEEPENPVKAGLDELLRRADEYADSMFQEEDHPDPDADLAERYIPGTDDEAEPEEEPRRRWERPPRRVPPPPPDTPPKELARQYTKGLNSLRLRCAGLFLLAALMVWLGLMDHHRLAVPAPLAPLAPYFAWALTAGLGLGLLLSLDLLWQGISDPFRGLTGLHTIAVLGALATLGDSVWYCLTGREGPFPYCSLSAVVLFFCLLGRYEKQKGQRLTCRTAAAASQPYLVTRDEAKWNGRGTFAKHLGSPAGFGSQVQKPDGAQRICRYAAPVLLLACVLFALLASVGRQMPERLPWCLSVILTTASPLSALLAFGLPYARIARRLDQSGAALAGWDGVDAMAGDSGILITDTDLFPPGSVSFNGIKVFGDFPMDKVVAVTASLIRDSGCGLDKLFHDLLRAQGTIYRRTQQFCCYEGGGLSAVIRGEQVLVGSASFMALMEVSMPQGLNVKNAVFCAIDGRLAGIFALSYTQPALIAPALYALIRNKVAPVLATRDFNIIPSMLRQRFKLPVERMEFPPVERRVELSAPLQDHDPRTAALLCREGLAPFADAVVGGRRLRTAVRVNGALACLASAVGALLGFYLCFQQAFESLEPVNTLVFLLLWAVPTALTSWAADRF